MVFDYETLRVIWWVALVLLACGFCVMDGFDLGIGMLLPFLGKSDPERRVIINSIGPTWESNQVWLILLGGVGFGAWPLVYATAFSGLYVALLVLLFALFMRPVGFDYRSKVNDPRWRSAWDWALFAGGLAPAFVLSIAAGNLLVGLPFQLDADFHSTYGGSFRALFKPFPLLCGIVGVAMFAMHGAVYLNWRTEGVIAQRSQSVIIKSAWILISGFVLAGVWIAFGIDGYQITSPIDANGVNTILNKNVQLASGLWLTNYRNYPWLFCAPALAIGATLFIMSNYQSNRPGMVFLSSSVVVIGIVITAAGSMFPFLLPSCTDPNSSLTVWDASASAYTLQLLFFVAAVCMPIVLAYTSWVYRVMRGKITVRQIRENDHSLY